MVIHNKKFINREQSWLEFNQRVLNEAMDVSVPLLDRLQFLSITASNLDEFFMVRVGGLQMLRERKVTRPDPAGLKPAEQLTVVRSRIERMMQDLYHAYTTIVETELPVHGLKRIASADLTPADQDYLRRYFSDEIYPVATPAAVESQFPLIAGSRLHIGVRLQNKEHGQGPRMAIIPLGANMLRFIRLPTHPDHHYVLLEELVCDFIDRFFPGENVLEATPFRISRYADMSVNEEWATDLAREMEHILKARQQSDCVWLEVGPHASRTMLSYLQRKLRVGAEETMVCPGPLILAEFNRLGNIDGLQNLRYEKWDPQANPGVDLGSSIFAQIARRDIVLFHPYESFDPVIRFVEEAAVDPNVLAIKQVLYRTSADSAIVSALRKAAANGKYVTALVELKARFDEARNIEWARQLEQNGIQVIFGVRGLKTHAKVCLVVRREGGRIVRYAHFGTGNYNEKTARLYADVGILTCDQDLGRDASSFFNAISGNSNPQPYTHIASAPHTLRNRILELIDGEAERSRQGQDGVILAKMNALVDPDIIQALYRASAAGVKISLCVRGICCLRPGVKNLSENISVISIIDRFLEHSRIFYFEEGGEQRMFISSADWMPRNLDRRIELMIPVLDVNVRKKLLAHLKGCLADNQKARRILSNGLHERVEPAGRDKRVRSQENEFRQAVLAAQSARRARLTVFEPHRPTNEASSPNK
ncbi:MAG: polyphosphate kinase 1 [Verrucomicrobia bacterium]|nr:polyphosphate kinase 1 [Verrucomicrobiota bacterium]